MADLLHTRGVIPLGQITGDADVFYGATDMESANAEDGRETKPEAVGAGGKLLNGA